MAQANPIISQLHQLTRAFINMATSRVLVAKRAFVSVILALAHAYKLVANINRDSTDDMVLRAYKRVMLKAHPDKGGKNSDMQRLQVS